MRVVLLLLTLVFVKIAAGQNNDTLYVYSPSGIWLREKPTMESEKISLIPFGYPITQILDSSESISTIEFITDYWVKIEYKNKNGYIFNGFTSIFKFPNECDKKNYINIQDYLETHYEETSTVDSTWIIKGKHMKYTQSYNNSITFENNSFIGAHCQKLISPNYKIKDGLNLFKAFSEICYTEFKEVYKNGKYLTDKNGVIYKYYGSAYWESIKVIIEENNNVLTIEICESVE